MGAVASSAGWAAPWWTTMVAISTVNWLAAWVLFVRSFAWKRREPENARYFLVLRTMGILFVSVALYRTVFVSSYPNRLAWFNTICNSPFVIRSMAFVAELCFNGMIAVILLRMVRELGLAAGGRRTDALLAKSPHFAFGCIVLAQVFAFGGLITQYLTLFAIEETLWAVAFFALVPLVVTGLKAVGGKVPAAKSYKTFLVILAIWCAGYLAFQCFFALPFTHYANLAEDIGRVVPPDALRQAIFNFIATRDFECWGGIGFFIWHSGYFSICSWMVLYFMTAPRLRGGVISKAAQ